MRNAAAIFAIIAIFFAAAPALALEYPQHYDKYVDDFAGIFSPDEAQQLRSLFTDVERNSTAEVVIVTVSSLEGAEISQYATGLFQSWGIGKKGEDNGLLVLYAKAENKVWVTTGYGLEGMLPDSKIGRMLDEYYVPERDAGNVTTGIIAFSEQAVDIIMDSSGEVAPMEKIPPLIFFLPMIIIAIAIAVAAIISSRPRKCKRCGLKMKLVKTEPGPWGSNYEFKTYRCPNGHEERIKVSKMGNSGLIIAGGLGGGFGGGGFGGGGTGGGGAGR